MTTMPLNVNRDRFASALRQAVLECWAQLSQDTQRMIFEKAVVSGHHDERDCGSNWPSICTTIIPGRRNSWPLDNGVLSPQRLILADMKNQEVARGRGHRLPFFGNPPEYFPPHIFRHVPRPPF
jgi:hypothetical protein